MTDQFRALCANLTAALNDWQCETGDDRYEGLIDRARAALADEPAVPKGREPVAVAGQPSDEELTRLWFETDGRAVLGAKEYARAVLARWGNPAPQPVPVSERLQQMEDLAADAVAGLRYIEQSHGRLYGVGWDRVYKKADRLKPAHALPLPEVSK